MNFFQLTQHFGDLACIISDYVAPNKLSLGYPFRQLYETCSRVLRDRLPERGYEIMSSAYIYFNIKLDTGRYPAPGGLPVLSILHQREARLNIFRMFKHMKYPEVAESQPLLMLSRCDIYTQPE